MRITHSCTDPASVQIYKTDALIIEGAAPDALLVEWHPGPTPSCRLINLHTGWVRFVDDPDTLATISQTLAHAGKVFVPAKTLEKAIGMTHKQMLAFLGKHPKVSTRHPRTQRLEIHGPEFAAAYRPPARPDSQPSDDDIDHWVGTSDKADEVLDRWAARVRERTAAERRRRIGG